MILRVWILGILLIVILWIVWNSREGFQSGGSNPVASQLETRKSFWLIIQQQKAWSTVQGATISGGSKTVYPNKALLESVTNPKASDKLNVIFPNYISIYALAKYKMNPVAARNALINTYDILQNELVTAVQTPEEISANAGFSPASVCAELNKLTMFLYGKLLSISANMIDLSGTEITAERLHDENMKLQGSSACMNQGATPSAACIKLASQDQTLFPVLSMYDSANISLLTDAEEIQDLINILLQAYNGMKCNLPSSGSGPSITSVFSASYLESLGTVNTENLSDKLMELSPYYVSADTVTYIVRQLMSPGEFDSSMTSSGDYIKDMAKKTNAILSLTTQAGLGQLGSGKFFSESGSKAGEIMTCPAGYFCLLTSGAPIPCPVGSYCPEGTTENPIKCPPGRYSDSGKSSIEDCITTPPPGYYVVNRVATQCPAGSYCPTTSESPIPCPAGTYNAMQGKTDISACIHCPAGSYCSPLAATGATQPIPCPAGTSSTTKMATDKSVCIPCPVGTTCISKGLSTPVQCPAGTYSATVGLTNPCKLTPAGRYSQAVGATTDTSVPCGIGYYCPEGSGSEVPCPPGSYCGAASLAAPTPCPAGTYGATSILTSATCTGPCAAGYYCQPGSVSATQQECPAGYYCTVGTTSPVPCPAGTYCPYGSANPMECPVGTYSNSTGGLSITDCLPCPPGSVCGTPRTVVPSSCPLGHFCPTGSIQPTPCTAGYYCDTYGLPSPIPCPRGTYSTTTAASSMAICSPCPAGTYSSLTGQTVCANACPIGSYCPKTRQCYIYTPPTSGSGSGSSSGSDSSASSSISVPIGTSSPVPCPIGSYCPETSMAEPRKCPAGSYSPSNGATSCTLCSPGTYCPSTGGSTQVQCPVGTYCPGGGPNADQCPVGKMCPVPGLSIGSECPPGYYCGVGTINPSQLCPAGSYSTGGATSSSCTPCVAGTFSTAVGATSAATCTPCAAGKYSSQGAASCTSCAVGTYSSSPGAGACTACPGSTFSTVVGSTSSADCNLQDVYANNGSVTCNMYCAGVNHGPWNGELPVEWNGATCVGTPQQPSIGCNTAPGSSLICRCQAAPDIGWSSLWSTRV